MAIEVTRPSAYYLSIMCDGHEYLAFTRLTTGEVYELFTFVSRDGNEFTRKLSIHAKQSKTVVRILVACKDYTTSHPLPPVSAGAAS